MKQMWIRQCGQHMINSLMIDVTGVEELKAICYVSGKTELS